MYRRSLWWRRNRTLITTPTTAISGGSEAKPPKGFLGVAARATKRPPQFVCENELLQWQGNRARPRPQLDARNTRRRTRNVDKGQLDGHAATGHVAVPQELNRCVVPARSTIQIGVAAAALAFWACRRRGGGYRPTP